MTPWKLSSMRSVVLDPHVKVVPVDPYEAIDKLYRLRVARNERRRLEAKCETLIFLKPQVGPVR